VSVSESCAEESKLRGEVDKVVYINWKCAALIATEMLSTHQRIFEWHISSTNVPSWLCLQTSQHAG
jgi:hypothetical protein